VNAATKTDATQILKEWNEGDKDAPADLRRFTQRYYYCGRVLRERILA